MQLGTESTFSISPRDGFGRYFSSSVVEIGNNSRIHEKQVAFRETSFTSGHTSSPPTNPKVQKLPAKLTAMLSNPDFTYIISWQPHGRAWKVHNTQAFLREVIPRFFENTNYNSFNRLVNAWGFRRILQGPDRNCYYHELFTRDLPHLQAQMRRLKPNEKKHPADPQNCPDFNRMGPIAYRAPQDYFERRLTKVEAELKVLRRHFGGLRSCFNPVLINSLTTMNLPSMLKAQLRTFPIHINHADELLVESFAGRIPSVKNTSNARADFRIQTTTRTSLRAGTRAFEESTLESLTTWNSAFVPQNGSTIAGTHAQQTLKQRVLQRQLRLRDFTASTSSALQPNTSSSAARSGLLPSSVSSMQDRLALRQRLIALHDEEHFLLRSVSAKLTRER